MLLARCRRSAFRAMRTKLLFAATVGFVVLGTACSRDEQHGAAEQQIVTVSAMLPLSGDLRFLGEPGQRALKLAEAEINSLGGVLGHHLRVDLQDTKGSGATAGLLVERLPKEREKRTLLTTLSGVSLEVARLSAEIQPPILQLVIAIHPEVIKPQYRNVRICYNAVDEALLIVEAIRSLKFRRVAALVSVDAVSNVEFEQYIQPELARSSIEIVGVERFNVGEADFRTVARRVAGLSPEVVVILGYGSDFPQLMAALRKFDELAKAKIIGGIGFIEVPAPVDTREYQNVLFTAPAYLLQSEESWSEGLRRFSTSYKEEDRSALTPPYDAVFTYASIMLWKQAVDSTQSLEPDQLLKYIRGLKEYNSIIGSIPLQDGDSHPAIGLARFSATSLDKRFEAVALEARGVP